MGFFDKFMNYNKAQSSFEKEFEKAMMFYKALIKVGFGEIQMRMKQFLLDFKHIAGIDATILKEPELVAISSIYLNTVLQLQKQEDKAISENKEELDVDWLSIKEVLFKTQPAYVTEDSVFLLMTYIALANKAGNRNFIFQENEQTIQEVSGIFEFIAKSDSILVLFDKHFNAIINSVREFSSLNTLECETATLLYLIADFSRAIAQKPRTGFCQELRERIVIKYNIKEEDILSRVSFYGDFTQGLKSVRGVWCVGDNGFLNSYPTYKCLGVYGDVIRYNDFYKNYQNALTPNDDMAKKTAYSEIILLKVRSEIDQLFNEIKMI